MKPCLCTGFVLALCMNSASSTVFAQPTVASVPREAASQAVTPTVRVASDSPRASVLRFHDLARRGRWLEASRYLDVPVTQSAEAPRLARELSEVIDYHFGWDLDGVSGESAGDVDDGLPPRVDEVGEVPLGRGAYGSVRVQRREYSEGARWVFARATVLRVEDWYDRLEGRWARERLPPALNARGPRDLRWWQWAALPLMVLASLLFGRALAAVLRRALDRIVGRSAVVKGESVGQRAVGPVTALAAALVAAPGIGMLFLSRDAEDFVLGAQRAIASVALFWAFWRAAELFGRAADETSWAREHPASVTLVPLGVKVARVIGAVVAIVAALSSLGYPVASLLAGLGLGGLALALAAQKTGEHLFGTVAIGFDQPFRVGDWVKVDDQEGTVEAVGLRSTRIRTLDRTVVSIPNGKLADMRTETVSARDRYRVHATLGLEHGTAPATLRAVLAALRARLIAHPKAHAEAPWVCLRRIGESSLDVEVSAWFVAEGYEDFLALRSEVLMSLLEVVEAEGARLAYPTRTVRLSK